MDKVGGTWLTALLKRKGVTATLYRSFTKGTFGNFEGKHHLSRNIVGKIASYQRRIHPLSKTEWSIIRREFSAVSKLLWRSGISVHEQRNLLVNGLHSSSQGNQNHGGGGSTGGSSSGSNGGGNKNDEDEKKRNVG